jgi:predicted dehydrogenase
MSKYLNNSKKIKRRDVLKSGTTLAIGIAFPAIVPSSVFGSTAPSNRVALGCIGLGSMGGHHLQALATMSESCDVVGLCDVNRNKLDSAQEVTPVAPERATQDFRELMARDDIDAVNIATPDHWHTPLAIAAIKAGKAVFLQKPVSINVREGRILSDAVTRYGAILQVGSQQRSSRNFRLACELVRNGKIGDVSEIQVGLEKPYNANPGLEPTSTPPAELDYEMWLGPAPWREYSNERVVHFRGCFDYSGGYFADWGAHHLDIVQWALDQDKGGPVWVDGRGVFHEEGIFTVPMSYEVMYRYEDGTRVIASEEFERGITFKGSEGEIFVSRDRFAPTPSAIIGSSLAPGDARLPVSDHHLTNFFDAVRQGTQPIVPAETGHRSATLCHIGNISMRLARPLNWDPVFESFENDDEANRFLASSSRTPWNFL